MNLVPDSILGAGKRYQHLFTFSFRLDKIRNKEGILVNEQENPEQSRTTARELIESVQRLANIVRALDRDFYRRRTWWWSLSHGLLYGIGTMVGAGIIAVILLYLVSQFQDVPWLGGILDRLAEQAAQTFERRQEIEETVIQGLYNYPTNSP